MCRVAFVKGFGELVKYLQIWRKNAVFLTIKVKNMDSKGVGIVDQLNEVLSGYQQVYDSDRPVLDVILNELMFVRTIEGVKVVKVEQLIKLASGMEESEVISPEKANVELQVVGIKYMDGFIYFAAYHDELIRILSGTPHQKDYHHKIMELSNGLTDGVFILGQKRRAASIQLKMLWNAKLAQIKDIRKNLYGSGKWAITSERKVSNTDSYRRGCIASYAETDDNGVIIFGFGDHFTDGTLRIQCYSGNVSNINELVRMKYRRSDFTTVHISHINPGVKFVATYSGVGKKGAFYQKFVNELIRLSRQFIRDFASKNSIVRPNTHSGDASAA